MGRTRLQAAAAGLFLSLGANAGALNYDAFCDRDGHIHEEHIVAAQAMMRDPEQLEALYAASVKGNARAVRAFRELETVHVPLIGYQVAERECLLPIKRELVPGCVPDWSYISFLRSDRPGGARMRKAIADAYAERMRERGFENRLIAASLNAILAMTVVGTVSRQAAVATIATPATLSSMAARAAPSGLGDLTITEVEQIQSVVERAGRPLEVVGSAAKGARRGVGTDLPIGKGPGTRSDIDYLVPPASASYFTGLASQLPGLDLDGYVVGTQNPFIGPAVRFEPGVAPRFVPGAKP